MYVFLIGRLSLKIGVVADNNKIFAKTINLCPFLSVMKCNAIGFYRFGFKKKFYPFQKRWGRVFSKNLRTKIKPTLLKIMFKFCCTSKLLVSFTNLLKGYSGRKFFTRFSPPKNLTDLKTNITKFQLSTTLRIPKFP